MLSLLIVILVVVGVASFIAFFVYTGMTGVRTHVRAAAEINPPSHGEVQDKDVGPKLDLSLPTATSGKAIRTEEKL